MPRNKRSACNSGLNVPMIVYFPPNWRHLAPKDYNPGGASDRLVSFVDLAPTVLSLAGVKPPDWMQGGAFAGRFVVDEPPYSYGFRGRMDERYDLVRSVRDKRYMYVRNYMPHRPHGQHCAYMFDTPTTRAWHALFVEGKLNQEQAAFWQPKQPEELYDLESDPDEVHNLAASPDHQETLARMRKAHSDWAHHIKDVGFLSEWEMHERSKDGTPYEIAHDASKYDFNAIFAAANMASSLKPADLPALVSLLADKDSGVRYWAATGLLAQQAAGVDAGRDALVTALSDESPIVRITAAEALGCFGTEADVPSALDVLIHYVQPESNVYLSVAAWNALDYLDDRARPALATLKDLSQEAQDTPEQVGGYGNRLKHATLEDLR